MRTIILYVITSALVCSCKAQENLKMQYVGNQTSESFNSSFINNTFIFLRDNDTLKMNVKVPFDLEKMEINSRGLYYNCILRTGTVYTFSLKKIKPSDIPEEYNSYYKTNLVLNNENSSKFQEIKKNTSYLYKGNYEKYIDINNVLYEIVDLSPNTDCALPH